MEGFSLGLSILELLYFLTTGRWLLFSAEKTVRQSDLFVNRKESLVSLQSYCRDFFANFSIFQEDPLILIFLSLAHLPGTSFPLVDELSAWSEQLLL